MTFVIDEHIRWSERFRMRTCCMVPSSGRYNHGMEEYVDEITLLAVCVAASVLFADANLIVVGVLLSISLVCACGMAGPPYRIAAQIAFLVCTLVLVPAFFFLPVCVYVMLHERHWALRLLWLVPLAGAPFLGTVSSSGCAIVALSCALSVLLGIKDARVRAERAGMQFAFDDLRERNLELLADIEACSKADGSASVAAPTPDGRMRATGPFCDLTEREFAVAKLVAEGMDNRDIAATLFLSEGTVRNHISSILNKLELGNRIQIAVLYYRG